MLQAFKLCGGQVEIPSETIIFVARHNFLVVLEVSSYHGWKVGRCCNRRIINLTASEVLRHAVSFLLHSSGIL